MLEDERKSSVHALSDDELRYEVARGRASRFQGALYDYAKFELKRRDEEKRAVAGKATFAVAEQSRNWTRWGVIAAAIAIVVAVLLAFWSKP